MQNQQRLVLICNQCRYICIGNTYYKSNPLIKLGTVMGKVMKRHQPRRKWFEDELKVATLPDVSIKGTKVIHNIRRSSVFNKLFMQHVTDLMGTGEIAPNLLGYKLQISRMEVISNFRGINIYWFASNEKDDEAIIEETLVKAALQLRNKLCQLNVLGIVPKLNFVKDKEYNILMEIDRKLAIADYGDDNESSDNESELNGKSTKTRSNTLEPNDSDKDENDIYNVFVPEMKNNVLGLNHHYIMTKVKVAMQKSNKAANDQPLKALSTLSKIGSFEATQYLTAEQEKELFTSFLRKRKIEEKKRRKMENMQYAQEHVCTTNEDNYDANFDNEIKFYDDFKAEM